LTVTVVSPLQQWRQTHFGTTANSGNAADLADPDNDNLNNLLEFALGTSPLAPSAGPTVQVSGVSPQPSFLNLTFFRARPPSDLTYEVQATSDLTSPASWSTVATNPGTVGTEVSVSDSAPLPSSGPRFMRLKVTAP